MRKAHFNLLYTEGAEQVRSARRLILRYKSRPRNDTARNLALRILEFQILKPASFWLPQKKTCGLRSTLKFKHFKIYAACLV